MDLAYFLSKAFWFLARPGNLVLLIILIGTLVAWIRPAKSGRIWLTSLSALLLFVAFAPVTTWIARPLEHRFPPPASLPAKIDGIKGPHLDPCAQYQGRHDLNCPVQFFSRRRGGLVM